MTTSSNNAKGPASAATDPDHGSTIPGKGNIMNVQTSTNAAACAQDDHSHTVESLALDTKVLTDVIGEMLFTSLETNDTVFDSEMCERVLTMQLILQERAGLLLAAARRSGVVA